MKNIKFLFKSLYHCYAFIGAIFLTLLMIFSDSIPVYYDEPFTDTAGLTWRNENNKLQGYQLITTEQGLHRLRIYALDKYKNSHLLDEIAIELDFSSHSNISSSSFYNYDGRQVKFNTSIAVSP
ncbi:TPA: hypothetical protein I8273_000956 [Aeromonas hydrophila]|nr:hypothetical protein [Aeromonas hydrophila]HAT2382350.1 hypothetical protein [Aeromonas hydrophila]HAT2415095.1 hypothetical protein [Aeromonas hydrophila]HAT2572204.1 hypothetical protein [Aeromonas hydrophila]HAT2577020.1 hypothetical protein [Aeromonas hydrophila]